MRKVWGVVVLCAAASLAQAELAVTGIQATHREGQTFVTWKDVATETPGAQYRYSVYRSAKPITQETLDQAELCESGILNNSAKMFGSAFNLPDRLNPSKPTVMLKDSGDTLPMWTGVTAVTTRANGNAFYAVVATDTEGKRLTAIAPGQSATTEPVAETVAPIQPIKVYDSQKRGQYSAQTCITGAKNLPLWVELHASGGQGGGASAWGDYYLYFATREMGWRDGLQGVFSVEERRPSGKGENRLVLTHRDAIEHPNGRGAMETYWFGYLCVPQWAEVKEPRTYPFTETRMLWLIDWTVKKYGADPERVFAGGGSMGAWGSSTFAFRHPEIFAAVYPNRPRTRQKGLPALAKLEKGQTPLMPDGKTSYFDRMDMVKFATEHHDDLPFIGWCCGRRDGFATWQEQIDMVKALTAAHHGFAFAWNNGDHSSGAAPMGRVMKYYDHTRFARNRSYPAFGNSSINDNPGNGDPKDGDLGNDDSKKGPVESFGINLGFIWSDVVDSADRWSVKLSNELAKAEMTVDVTPRRCSAYGGFKPKAGDKFAWTNTAGGDGEATADQWGLVTVEKVKIKPGEPTVLTIKRK